MKATKIDQSPKRPIPCEPAALKIAPPSNAPSTPTTRVGRQPPARRPVAAPASDPAARPTTIHARSPTARTLATHHVQRARVVGFLTGRAYDQPGPRRAYDSRSRQFVESA